MLHRIKELFQKTSNLKVENKSNFHGRLTAENGTQERIQQNQHGRSMVEMLGVLAIMGILSIGGVAGYNYAMDKYRAGETINDINLRGVDLIIQASRNIPLNLEEWSNTSTAGYTFGTPEQADGFIKLPISGLPERVCEMVVNDLSAQFDVDVGADRYAGDTSLCGENNTVTVYFDNGSDGTGGACADVTCPECQLCINGSCTSSPDNITCDGGYCENGLCIKEGQPEDSVIMCHADEDCVGNDLECVVCDRGYCDNWQRHGNECHEDNIGEIGVCIYGSCQIGKCANNNDCASGYFCADTNESCTEAHPNKCRKLDFVRANIPNEWFEETTTWSEETTTLEEMSTEQKVPTLSDDTSEIWYASKYPLSWWDAKNACEKLGKRMATEDEINRRREVLIRVFGEHAGYYVSYWASDGDYRCRTEIVAMFALCR